MMQALLKRFTYFISIKRHMIILYVFLTVMVSVQCYLRPHKTDPASGKSYTQYNNYVIFKNSFDHLREGKDLYTWYLDEQWDLYKYTPTFAAYFGIYAIFPDLIGLTLWNLTNSILLLLSIYYLPRLSLTQKGWISLIIIPELITSMQNSQSNALVAALLVFAFGLLEKRKWWWASLCIVSSAFIKLFGIVGFALYLFYPRKWKLILMTITWVILLAMIPLVWIDIHQYKELLSSYSMMLSEDHSASYGLSVMGWLDSWFGIDISKNVIVMLGTILFMLPFTKIRDYKIFDFRFLALTSILIWIVIFNHKAESPTFIIAMTGIALWYVRMPRTKWHQFLFGLSVVFTSLSATDLFPASIRTQYVIPYVLKAVPCILIWIQIIWEMMTINPSDEKLRDDNLSVPIN